MLAADHPEASVKEYPAGERVERRLRRISAWLVLCLLLQAELGLAWDRKWHDLIGRDQFWIPPHMLIYSGLGVAGLVALTVVLVDTLRYRRGAPGADSSSTVDVFRFFHAPLGFILLGFGALTDLIAAPLDNYWHELYGIDVTLWSPFHIMGTIGAIIGGIGLLYAFAAEAVLDRETAYPSRHFLGLTSSEWGSLVLIAAFMEVALPALTAFTPIMVGPLVLVTYPLPLALVGASCLTAAIRLTRKPGAATITVLILCLLSLVTQAFVPWGLREMVAQLGLSFRFTTQQPIFNVTLALLPLLFLTYALLVDGIAFWQQRHGHLSKRPLPRAWLLGTLCAFPAVLIPSWVVQLLKSVPALPLPPDVLLVLQPTALEMLLALPLALVIGALGAILGGSLGDIWYWNRR